MSSHQHSHEHRTPTSGDAMERVVERLVELTDSDEIQWSGMPGADGWCQTTWNGRRVYMRLDDETWHATLGIEDDAGNVRSMVAQDDELSALADAIDAQDELSPLWAQLLDEID